jgi:hypothetical protein
MYQQNHANNNNNNNRNVINHFNTEMVKRSKSTSVATQQQSQPTILKHDNGQLHHNQIGNQYAIVASKATTSNEGLNYNNNNNNNNNSSDRHYSGDTSQALVKSSQGHHSKNQVKFKISFGPKSHNSKDRQPSGLMLKANIKPALTNSRSKHSGGGLKGAGQLVISNGADMLDVESSSNQFMKSRGGDDHNGSYIIVKPGSTVDIGHSSIDSAGRDQTHSFNRLVKMAGTWNQKSRSSAINSEYGGGGGALSAASSYAQSVKISSTSSSKLALARGDDSSRLEEAFHNHHSSHNRDNHQQAASSSNNKKSTNMTTYFNSSSINDLNSDLNLKLSLTNIQLNYGFNDSSSGARHSGGDSKGEMRRSKELMNSGRNNSNELSLSHRRALASSQNHGIDSTSNRSKVLSHYMIKA